MIFALYERPEGVAVADESRVVYDIERNVASLGAARVDGPAIVWALRGEHEGAALAVRLDLDATTDWLVRCDRVDFPPGGVAYQHVHPGPGIRRLLFGELTIEAEDGVHTYDPGGSWFEGAGYPVLATASVSDDTAFVRVILVPAELAGERTIRYLDPADDERPKLQRAEILLEEPLRL